MWEWILLFTLAGLPFLFGLASRCFMLRALTRGRAGWRAFCGLCLAGACKDLLPLALALAAHQAALYVGFLTALPRFAVWLPALAAILLGWLVLVLSVLDAGVFYNTRQRVFPIFLAEITSRNIAVALGARQKAGLAALLLLLVGYAACFFAPFRPSGALLAASCALAAAGLLGLLLGRLKISAGHYVAAYSSGPYRDLREQVGGKLAVIGASSLANLLDCLRGLRQEKRRALRPEAYSRSEQRSLEQLGLLGGERYAGRCNPGAGPHYKRIILVCLESISQRLLPFYNRALDPALTPFLQTLLTHSPRLDELWTANSPTDQGLYALHASRLGYEYDLKHGAGRIDSLSGLLRERGYAAYALSGVTRHFGNKDVFFKRLLRYQHFLAEEDLRGRPGSSPLGWGLSDRSVYSAALDLLEEQRGGPVLLTVETANTHAPGYYSLPEERFPSCVAASSSRLLRALYEVDLDLLFFYTQLQARGLFDRETLLLITADHSPNHGNEYLSLFNPPDFRPERIPFICVTPEQADNPFAGIRKNIVCSQLDLLPTLAEGLGLPLPATAQGRSLFRGEDCPVIRKFGEELNVRHGRAELRVNLREGGGRFDGLKKWYYNSLLQPYQN